MAIRILVSTTHTKIDFSKSPEQKKDFERLLVEKFTVRNPAIERDPRVLRGIMRAEHCFYDKDNQILPTGLLPHLRIYAKKENFEVELKDYREFPSGDKKLLKQLQSNKAIKIGKKELRDYQVAAILDLYKYKGGLLEAATGAGKSLMIATLCHLYKNEKILILFNRIELLHQTRDIFINEYGFKESEIGCIGGGYSQDDARITMMTIQSYQNIFHLFPQIRVLITDECHETGRAPTAEKIIYSCQNATLRFGFSATISVIDNPYEKMKLHANIGPIVHKVEYTELRDVGSLAKIHVAMYKIGTLGSIKIVGSWNDVYDNIKIKDESEIKRYENEGYEIKKDGSSLIARKFVEYGDQSLLYSYNEKRNNLIVDIAKKKERVLILFTNIAHGEELKKLLPDSILIHGGNDRFEREAAKRSLKEKKDSIVLASDIFSTGVDVPSIKTLILAGSSVSSVKVIQKLGRATRNDKELQKFSAEIIDFLQSDNPLSLKQSKKRIKIYEDILKIPVQYF